MVNVEVGGWTVLIQSEGLLQANLYESSVKHKSLTHLGRSILGQAARWKRDESGSNEIE